MTVARSANTVSSLSWSTAAHLGKVGISSALGCLPFGILHGLANTSSLFVIATGIVGGIYCGKFVVSRMEKNGSRTEMLARDIAMRYARHVGITSGILSMFFAQALTQKLFV